MYTPISYPLYVPLALGMEIERPKLSKRRYQNLEKSRPKES